jgi:putative membrane protein
METTSRRPLWIALIILGVLMLLVLPTFGTHAFVARPFVGPFVGPWFFGFGLFAVFARLLIWGALIFLVVRLFRGAGWRRFDDYGRRGYGDLPPAEILRRRYAAGEISREQYDEMRQTLEPHPMS